MALPLTSRVAWGEEMNRSSSTSSSPAHPARDSCLMVCMDSSEKPELSSAVCKVPFHLLNCDISCLLATEVILTGSKTLLQQPL